MAKDKNGSFHPPKGRPTGSPKESTGLRDAFAITDLEKDNELTEKYLNGQDEPAANVHIRHVNRHTDKGEDNDENRQA